MRLFDTHAHLYDQRFDEDRDAVIRSLPGSGVVLALVPGCDIPTSRQSAALAQRYKGLYFACGTHPHQASDWRDEDEAVYTALLSHPKGVAVGEIGLDYHYDFSPREVQQSVFQKQLRLAHQLNLPVILHNRESTGDMLALLKEEAAQRGEPLTGVMHCFSGSVETARECVKLGLYISFGGSLTFKNARILLDVAADVPEDRLLIETDSPYLAPVPHRGKRNDPSLVALVAQKLAELRNSTAEQIAQLTMANGKRLFGID